MEILLLILVKVSVLGVLGLITTVILSAAFDFDPNSGWVLWVLCSFTVIAMLPLTAAIIVFMFSYGAL